jgi:hypothetical protein
MRLILQISRRNLGRPGRSAPCARFWLRSYAVFPLAHGTGRDKPSLRENRANIKCLWSQGTWAKLAPARKLREEKRRRSVLNYFSFGARISSRSQTNSATPKQIDTPTGTAIKPHIFKSVSVIKTRYGCPATSICKVLFCRYVYGSSKRRHVINGGLRSPVWVFHRRLTCRTPKAAHASPNPDTCRC